MRYSLGLISDFTEEIQLFKNLYSQEDEFRHSYSSITALLLRISRENEDAIVNITQNLNSLMDQINESGEETNSYFVIKIGKLVDHIVLEQIRIDGMYIKSDVEFRKAAESYQDAVKLRIEVDEILEKSKDLKIEVVTILSIFAAILLAVVGSLSFTTSVLQTMNSASVYRVVLLALVCGIVIFNTISVLLYVVAKIVNKPIYARCKTDDCTCEPMCHGVNRIKKRMPYIYWFNFLILCFILAIGVCWLVDIRIARTNLINCIYHR